MRRKFGLFLVCGAVLPLIFAASAHAQGAVMLANPKVATPGQLVTVTGSGFGNGDVTIRLNRRNAEPVGGTVTDTAGRISTVIAAPATPGQYLLIGTQTTPVNGRQRAFTPGRTRLRVAAAAARGAGGTGPSDGFGPAIPLGAGLGFLLLAGGLTLTVRRQRALRRPAVAPHAASSR